MALGLLAAAVVGAAGGALVGTLRRGRPAARGQDYGAGAGAKNSEKRTSADLVAVLVINHAPPPDILDQEALQVPCWGYPGRSVKSYAGRVSFTAFGAKKTFSAVIGSSLIRTPHAS